VKHPVNPRPSLARHDGPVAHVIMFHSVYGLRPAVLAAAAQLRAAGHEVIAPDLYAGQVAATVDEGFVLCDQIGWPVILRRARQALAGLPPEAVLAGLSMGAAVAAALLGERPGTAGLLLVHNTGSGDTGSVRPGLRLQLHIADPDVYQSVAEVAAWEQSMTDAGAAVQVFRYPGAGHLFTDPGTADHDGPAAELAWQRGLSFLAP
jgi:dienelactone hydrolase